ncbi:Aldo/keto reductase, partial [Zopfia rhizophila CBS 207.26]
LIIYGTAIRKSPKPIDISSAIKAGYGGIDTAGSRKLHNELADGASLSDLYSQHESPPRTDLLIQSKFITLRSQADPWPYCVEDELRIQVFKSIARTCSDLQIDLLDVYFLPRPLDTFQDTCVAWRAMEEVVNHGGIRYLGVCHVDVDFLEQLYDVATIKPKFVQTRYCKLDDRNRALRDFCVEHNIVLQVFGILWQQNADLLQIKEVSKLAESRCMSMQQALHGLIL